MRWLELFQQFDSVAGGVEDVDALESR